MKFSAFFLVGLLSVSFSGNGQYFQFSQYNFSNQRVNPALIGTTRYAAVELLTRTQKTGGDFNINSNFVSASYPLINASTGRPWAGIGVALLDDRSGGIFNTQEAALTYSVNVRLNRFQVLSFGAKALYQSRRINTNGFYTGSQYVPDRGFDESISSGENFGELRNSYTTFSAGLQFLQSDRRGNLTSYWGLSIFDLNQHEDLFFKSNTSLSSTLVINGGFEAYRYNALAIFPEVLYTGNSNNHLFNAGARFQYELLNPKDHINILAKYVPGRSGIIGMQLDRETFGLGVSYDFPLFTSNPGNLGALEVGLVLKRLISPNSRNKSRTPQKQAPNKPASNGMVRRPKLKPLEKKVKAPSDSLPVNATPEIEIVKNDSISQSGNAQVGRIKSEPFLVEKITLRFHFDFNSIDLDDETENFLENMETTLKEDPKIKLKITGHTDNIGNEKFNQRLSVKRAQTVKDFLVKKGIDPARIEANGKGWEEPIDSNETTEGRSKNRRVEISVLRSN
jgi:type IX secretion system PorP/SprF family membrane protein